jgi:hypothetical protein
VAQPKTEAHLVLRHKPRNYRGDFETQITKLKLSVLRPKPENPSPTWFWDSTKKLTTGFEAKSGETVATNFEAKLEKTTIIDFEAKPSETVAAGFEAKPLETVASSFEIKPLETVRVVLMSNHSQTVDIGFKAQPINLCSSFPRARCRSHTTPPDLSIAWTSSIWPVRPSSVLCTRCPTPVTIIVTARHATLATCTPRDKQTRFFKWNKDEKQNKTILDLNSNLTKSMTHHNETKKLTTQFINLPLDESIDNKSKKFEFQIHDPMKHS